VPSGAGGLIEKRATTTHLSVRVNTTSGSGGCGACRGRRLDGDRSVIGPVAGDHEAHRQRDRADDGNDEDPQRIQAADKRHRDDREHRDSDDGGSDRDEMKPDPLCDVPSVQGSQRVLRAKPQSGVRRDAVAVGPRIKKPRTGASDDEQQPIQSRIDAKNNPAVPGVGRLAGVNHPLSLTSAALWR